MLSTSRNLQALYNEHNAILWCGFSHRAVLRVAITVTLPWTLGARVRLYADLQPRFNIESAGSVHERCYLDSSREVTSPKVE